MNEPPNGATAVVYSFGPFKLDVRKRRLLRDDEIVAITAKAFDTLLVLVRHGGQVVEKDDLMRMVWCDTSVGDETLAQIISKLRKALGDHSEQPDYIATLPRRGYCFVADVVEMVDAGPGHPLDREGNRRLWAPLGTEGAGAPAGPAKIRHEAGFAVPAPKSRRELLWMSVAAVSVSLTAVMAFTFVRRDPPPVRATIQVAVPLPPRHLVNGGVELSPDGRHIAFAATDPEGHRRLWVHPLDGRQAYALPDTDGASHPFWSPDSRSIAFFTSDKLKRVSLGGGLAQILAEAQWAGGGTWNRNGIIVFPPLPSGGLVRVHSEGGAVSPLTTLDVAAGERAHLWPSFLPDGRHFLYRIASNNPQRAGTYVGSIDSAIQTRILDGTHSAAVYAEPSALLFVREQTLLAQAFDARRLRLDGPAVAIATGVPAPDRFSGRRFSAAANDVLAFLPEAPSSSLVWFSRDGQRLGTLEGSRDLLNPTLSPDDREVVGQRWHPELSTDIWRVELRRGVSSRLVTDGLPVSLPVWSPDAREIAFSSVNRLYRRSAAGHGADELLIETSHRLLPQDWSVDGHRITYVEIHPETKLDLWTFSLKDRKAAAYLRTRYNELHGQISPDGRWMAYASDESGDWEVYVQSVPVPGGKLRVSTRGGAQPKWRRDGRELYYLSANLKLMAVAVRGGDTLELGAPIALFRVDPPIGLTYGRNVYTVTADGQRFLVSTVDSEWDTRSPIAVVVNWARALGR